MTVPLASVLAFAMWTLGLVVVGVAYHRVTQVLAGKARANSFPADTPHGSDIYRRTIRAHLNCVENLPVFASVVFVAHLAGHRSTAFDALAVVTVLARVAQTTAHIASPRNRAVLVRFAFFCVQCGAVLAMVVLLAMD